MKIAYLLGGYPTLGETFLLREVRELRALGWDIQTISIRKPRSHGSELSPAEQKEFFSTWYVLDSGPLEFLKAHIITFFARPVRYLRGIATAFNLGRFHSRQAALATAHFVEAVLVGYRLHKAGISHVHSVYTSTVGLILARVFDVGLSMTIHGPAEFFDAEGFQIREKVRTAQFVCSISYFGRSQIMSWSSPSDWHKLEVTPLGVDLASWELATFREHPTPFSLISVARLTQIKGHSLLIESVALLVSKGRNVRLTLVGDGPDRCQLEKQARRLGIVDRIIFAGLRNQDELNALYRQSDLCVLSSFAEGIPVALMEAMATGLPCVASRITGIPELIRHGVEGLLVTPSNTEELACAIAELMDMPDLRRRMAGVCRERIADKFDLRKNVLHLSEVFSRRLSQNPSKEQDHDEERCMLGL